VVSQLEGRRQDLGAGVRCGVPKASMSSERDPTIQSLLDALDHVVER
jgi:hypothetical protein